nr:hypothetical protein [Cupriavidus sp. D39]
MKGKIVGTSSRRRAQRVGARQGAARAASGSPVSTLVQGGRKFAFIKQDLRLGDPPAASEAASLAGDLYLGKLIYLYDDNGITLSASTGITFTEDTAKRFEAYGWRTLRSHLGFGAPNKQDTFEADGPA